MKKIEGKFNVTVIIINRKNSSKKRKKKLKTTMICAKIIFLFLSYVKCLQKCSKYEYV